MSLLATLHHAGWLRAVDHALALTLRHARPETPDAVLAAAALASRALALGHSRVPLAHVAMLFGEIDATRAPPALPSLEDWRMVLRASPWVADTPDACDRVLVLQDDALSLRRYADDEQAIADALAARLPRLQLVTGGPGTGKTTQVATLLRGFLHDWPADAPPPRIALAAPTGKAASRLAESVRESAQSSHAHGEASPSLAAALPEGASTLHRLLGWQRDGFRHGRTHPLALDLVVVDEASMIDLPMMRRLVDALPREATLVIVGDPDQLPSVDTGDVLAALCEASDTPGSPLHARRMHLQHPHRQFEGVDVARLAAAVRAGDAEQAIEGLAASRYGGVHWLGGGDAALREAVLAQALPAYSALASAPDPATALQAARAFRVLCALRDGPAGAQALNAAIAAALDPVPGGDGWFQGRLVIVTENSYRQQLFNGDIGIAWPDVDGRMRVWFDVDGGPRPWLPAALPAHETAFALTVHKSQGSEFDRVFLVLPDAGSRVLSRELLYTGLTRCRSEVTLWAGEAALRDAIGRRAHRWSGLAWRLRAATAGTGDAASDVQLASDAKAGAATDGGAMQGSLF